MKYSKAAGGAATSDKRAYGPGRGKIAFFPFGILSAVRKRLSYEQGYKMNFSIRPATERDCDELCVISDQVNKLIQDNLPEHSKEVPVWVTVGDAFLKSLNVENEVIFVAEENRKVVGFVTASIETEPDDLISVPYVMVDRLAVMEGCKRRGIGRSLMERVHEWAREKGIGVLRLAVWAFNNEAVAFYDMLGYATVESIMEKTLKRETR